MFDQRALVLGQVVLRGRRMGQIPGWGPGMSLAIMPPTTSAGPTFPMNAVSTDPSAGIPSRKPGTADILMMGGIGAVAAAAVYGMLS